MQHRIKQNPLSDDRIKGLLVKEEVGRLVTVYEDGYPYAVPVHFVYHKNKIYIHGLPTGQKLANIQGNAKVCFELDKMYGYLKEGVDMPCNVNTDYESIVILGNAKKIDEFELKKEVLQRIVKKYAAEFEQQNIPDKMIRGTAIIEVEIKSCTGKYYNQSSLDKENADS